MGFHLLGSSVGPDSENRKSEELLKQNLSNSETMEFHKTQTRLLAILILK
jgi:hypothetical protein